MKISESQLFFNQNSLEHTKTENINKLNELLSPYSIVINHIKIKSSLSPSLISPMCLINLNAKNGVLKLGEKEFLISPRTIAITPPSERMHIEGDLELLTITHLKDTNENEPSFFEEENLSRNLYHSRFLKIERIDAENIMISSELFTFTVLLNLEGLQFRKLEMEQV